MEPSVIAFLKAFPSWLVPAATVAAVFFGPRLLDRWRHARCGPPSPGDDADRRRIRYGTTARWGATTAF